MKISPQKQFFIAILITLLGAALSMAAYHICLAIDIDGFKPPYQNDDVNTFLEGVLVRLQSFIGYLAVMFVVIGGILYMASGGNQNMITMAKGCWTSALIGIALAAVAPSFLKEIKGVLFNGALPETPDQIPGLKDIVTRALAFLLSIAGTVAIIGIVISGIMFITSGVNRNQAETAKKALQYSILGVVIAGLSLALVQEITDLLT